MCLSLIVFDCLFSLNKQDENLKMTKKLSVHYWKLDQICAPCTPCGHVNLGVKLLLAADTMFLKNNIIFTGQNVMPDQCQILFHNLDLNLTVVDRFMYLFIFCNSLMQ